MNQYLSQNHNFFNDMNGMQTTGLMQTNKLALQPAFVFCHRRDIMVLTMKIPVTYYFSLF